MRTRSVAIGRRAGIGALVGLVGLLVLPLAQASAKVLPFKPGHYAGYSSQKCPAQPVPAGACQAGERLPISFTVTRHGLPHLSVLIVETCEGQSSLVHAFDYPAKAQGPVKAVPILNGVVVKSQRALLLFQQDFQEGGADLGRDGLSGEIRGSQASGRLTSLLSVNAQGELGISGDVSCETLHPVHWQAKLQQGSPAARTQQVAVLSKQPGSVPYINSGFANRPVEPTRFSPGLVGEHPSRALTFTPVNNYVRSIRWSSWGGKEAVGSGRVSLLHGEPGYEMVTWLPEETSPVTVRLGGLRECLGVKVYSTYSLELAPGAETPMGWPRGQQGSFPCHIESESFDGGKDFRTDCGYVGLEPPAGAFGGNPHFQEPPWTPHLPIPGINWLDFCRLRSRNWGSSVATLIGSGVALLHPDRQDHAWPVKLELSHPVWCPSAGNEGPWPGGSAVTYGAIRLTLYGKGKTFGPGVSWPTARRGHQLIYWRRLQAKPSECLVGIEHRNPRYSPEGHHY
jgi:hypothetical protein